MICDVSLRMNALSSTTRTRSFSEDTEPLLQRPHFDSAILEEEEDAPTVIAAHILGDDRDLDLRQHCTNGGDVAFTDVDAAGGNEIREHARSTHDLRAHTFALRPEHTHLVQQERHHR